MTVEEVFTRDEIRTSFQNDIKITWLKKKKKKTNKSHLFLIWREWEIYSKFVLQCFLSEDSFDYFFFFGGGGGGRIDIILKLFLPK